MQSKTFTSGRIRRADYDESSRRLELHWDDKTVRAYAQVPSEVFRRLCAAPNPATYWEDRIAEEYPQAAAQERRRRRCAAVERAVGRPAVIRPPARRCRLAPAAAARRPRPFPP
ncbi:MAG: KTSC domain-containing protein [Hylemonella sp.]